MIMAPRNAVVVVSEKQSVASSEPMRAMRGPAVNGMWPRARGRLTVTSAVPASMSVASPIRIRRASVPPMIESAAPSAASSGTK